ncbi:MAG: hypothetical protein JO317_06810, partial [Verrucomicrobiae bacterium]|nr:hypothetical protein [Verrucomicrobiae bacterium]
MKGGISEDTQVVMAGYSSSPAKPLLGLQPSPCDGFYLMASSQPERAGVRALRKEDASVLVLMHQGETLDYRHLFGEQTVFWSILFKGADPTYRGMPGLRSKDPRKRVWTLAQGQVHAFKGLFVKVAAERFSDRAAHSLAAAAWLRLLMVTVERWNETDRSAEVIPHAAEPDLVQLWQKLHDMAAQKNDAKTLLELHLPNYDSLRHRFR